MLKSVRGSLVANDHRWSLVATVWVRLGWTGITNRHHLSYIRLDSIYTVKLKRVWRLEREIEVSQNELLSAVVLLQVSTLLTCASARIYVIQLSWDVLLCPWLEKISSCISEWDFQFIFGRYVAVSIAVSCTCRIKIALKYFKKKKKKYLHLFFWT